MPVKDIKRDENVNLPDDIGVVNWMKVKEGKFKTYEKWKKTFMLMVSQKRIKNRLVFSQENR